MIYGLFVYEEVVCLVIHGLFAYEEVVCLVIYGLFSRKGLELLDSLLNNIKMRMFDCLPTKKESEWLNSSFVFAKQCKTTFNTFDSCLKRVQGGYT